MELELTQEQRLRLKAQSHHLQPTVLLGAHGLTEAVLKEIDRALTAHELIKVRMPAPEREERERLAVQMAERLGAARIQLIGRLAVLFRPAPQEPHPRAARAPSSGRRPEEPRKRGATGPARPPRARPAEAKRSGRAEPRASSRGTARAPAPQPRPRKAGVARKRSQT